MPLLPAKIFLRDVLPGLIPRAPSFAHVVASYNQIGFPAPKKPTEVHRRNDLTTISFHNLDKDRMGREFVRVLRGETDPSAPSLATVYAGKTMFEPMMDLAAIVQDVLPGAKIVVLSCPCLGAEKRSVLHSYVRESLISTAVECECAGSITTRDIRSAVQRKWTPVHTDAHIPPSTNPVDLRA